jgi:flagellar biosynthesis protein FlhF
MIIKKFVASTMTKALAKVKDEFGDQAVILKTRMNRKSGGVGGLEDKNVEVTAAVETPTESRFEITSKPPRETEISTSSSSELPSKKIDRLAEEMANIKKGLDEKYSPSTTNSFFGYLSANMLKAGRDLVAHNLSEQLSHEIITNLAKSEDSLNLDEVEIKSRIKQKLSSMISSGEPIEIKDNGLTVVMFVGPTGSGKTSAVARVAMQYKVEKNENVVGIISADNFRADSSHQIKSFCKILGCPCGIVYSAEELSMAIKSKDQGLLLIDTPGVNPRDDRDLDELQSLIKAAKPHEVHLVVSA